ncbi:MAG: class I SAM-dependent methyltransferase [Halioglobus sp.]|nr:class I SAM-dependent methyltransferase [Halioglobus sp.]
MNAGRANPGAARRLLDAVLSQHAVTDDAGRQWPLHSQLPEEEGQALQHWFRESPARRVLEIGCAYGISSLYLCEAMAERDMRSYHLIDAYQSSQWRDIGRRHLRLARPTGDYALFEELSELCLPRLLAQGERYDFAFIDGWHTFDQVMLEFFYVNRMLEPGGVVVFDDMHLPALQKVLGYVSAYPCYERLPPPDTLAKTLKARVRQAAGTPVIRLQALRKTAQDERDWDWYADF